MVKSGLVSIGSWFDGLKDVVTVEIFGNAKSIILIGRQALADNGMLEDTGINIENRDGG